MSREFKFRAFDPRIKKMYPFVRMTWNGAIEARLVDDDPHTIADITIEHPEGSHDDYDGQIIVMQFTGLHDKEGKEIFEGDIVKTITRYPGQTFESISAVIWDDIQPAFVLKEGDSVEHDFVKCGCSEHEIVGNIYENAELLAKN